ncbi:SH3 domain-containing protein [Streptomyces sp. NPDC006997]|uniref:SH3 domain-containing protein n=1 Tax=Streptomyces sp. NPDC006997 TaxID=3155356 RepID=UPI0033D5D914
MKKRMLATAVLISGLTLAAGPLAQAAQAAPGAQAAVPAATAERQVIVCTVNDDRVNFRGGPGTNYPVLGQVNRGQQLHYRERQNEWVMGDLVGGRTGVWIHDAYLDGC